MIKERDRDRSPEKNGKMLIGFTWNCAAELKIFLMALLLLCTVATLFQFVPVRFSSDLRFCIDPKTTQRDLASTAAENATLLAAPQPAPEPEPPLQPSVDTDQILPNGVISRAFNPYGAAAYNFITMGTYRGGLNTFAIMGLASKPLHVFGQPTYECKWVPRNGPNVTGSTYKILPDWGYGRVYTAVVVNCTFSQPINADNSGGKLLLLASTSGGGDTKFNLTDTIPVLSESPGSVNFPIFSSPPKYDYFYCGSPVYGDLSPQRVREWIVYHVRLFGERSHFALYDAGGIHPEVMEVLQPWMELGYVTVQDVRDQERFDGYYHNQFMVVNDCLHQYRYMAKWMFLFDLDEFIYVPPKSTLKTVLNSLNDYSQFTIEQMPMNSKLCLLQDAPKRQRKWGFEKLVYKDVKKGIRRDRKYAIQPRNAYATGVHMSQNVNGKTTHKTEGRIKYFHYHGTIAQRKEPCRNFLNATETFVDKTPYVLDTTLRDAAPAIKKFELKMIGPRLQSTRQ